MEKKLILGIILVSLFADFVYADQKEKTMNEVNASYTKEYCHQLELAYGHKMMSEGGAEAIDHMFEEMDLKGKHILDFGSGLGGVAFYLGKRHEAHIRGVEINPRMVQEANTQARQDGAQNVSFCVIGADQLLPFPEESFDLIYSKGVITHLSKEQREIVFKEFYRVLKRGGKLVIHDWLSPLDGKWGSKIQALIESESLPLFACSPATYKKDLQLSGFKQINF